MAPGLVALGRVALDLVVLPKGLRPALGQAHVLLALVAHAGQRLDRVALDLVGPVGPVALAGLAGLAGAANLVLVCPVVHVGMAPCPRNQLGRPSDKALWSCAAARHFEFSSWMQALALRQNTEYRPRLEARGRGPKPGQMNISHTACSPTLPSRPESWADVRDGPIMDRLEDYAPEQSAGQRTPDASASI